MSVLDFGDWAGYMLFITLRVLSTFMASNLYGRNVPNVAKIVLSVLISYLIFGVMDISEPLEFAGVFDFAVACIKEIILGASIGILIQTAFGTVYIAGQQIDTHLGFGFSQIYDAVTGVQANITSQLFNIVLTLLFFITNAHHTLFKLIGQTFTQMPPGKVVFSTDMVNVVLEAFVNSFVMGLQISMPILAVSLMLQILLGVVMKSMPQMNFFVIGFPIKIIVGFIVFMLMMPFFVNMSETIFTVGFTAIQDFFGG